MRVLVFGATGQVGSELMRDPRAVGLTRADADLRDPAACANIIKRANVDAIINAAAYTDVDGAEKAPGLAHVINGRAPSAMAIAAARRDIPFLHISTDYVFDGKGHAAWTPKDLTAPLQAYGRSKLAAERAIREIDGPHAILRTSWVFSDGGHNFPRSILRAAATRDEIAVVNDQVGAPTYAADIAETLLQMAEQLVARPSKSGLYHYASHAPLTWAAYAREVLQAAGSETLIRGIPSSARPTPAKRPANSRLCCASLRDVFGIERPDWRTRLPGVVAASGQSRSGTAQPSTSRPATRRWSA
ncbi:MAG: dTDP-4-dehydrorhamnose reductase [Pseudomonadota bacterium]